MFIKLRSRFKKHITVQKSSFYLFSSILKMNLEYILLFKYTIVHIYKILYAHQFI